MGVKLIERIIDGISCGFSIDDILIYIIESVGPKFILKMILMKQKSQEQGSSQSRNVKLSDGIKNAGFTILSKACDNPKIANSFKNVSLELIRYYFQKASLTPQENHDLLIIAKSLVCSIGESSLVESTLKFILKSSVDSKLINPLLVLRTISDMVVFLGSSGNNMVVKLDDIEALSLRSLFIQGLK